MNTAAYCLASGKGVTEMVGQRPTEILFFAVVTKFGFEKGPYALPGGHLEFNEPFSACATREVLEETGLVVDHVRFLTVTNNIMREDNKHYITIFIGAKIKDGSSTEPKVGGLLGMVDLLTRSC